MSAAPHRQYHFAVGKRKSAIARVRLYEGGSGTITVNGKALKEYFRGIEVETVLSPLALTDTAKIFDADVVVTGGGKSAQSDAVRHGISRSLILVNPDLRITLKRQGYLRRDDRIKERKKPGLKRARRAPQFSKR